MKLSAPITISVLLALTAGLPAAAQTETGQPPAPAWLAEETVCPWDNVNDKPRLARVCLQAAGVNTGLAEYAFAEEPWDYDPDTPTPSGTPEEAGLVSRWAMGEAIHRMIETAVEEAGGQTPGLPANHRPVFTDIGWLGEDTRRKLELLFHWGITTGTNVYGEYSPTQTVTRAQMARFFVRSLAAIDRFTDGEGTPDFAADDTWQTLGRETDAFEIPAPFADVQAGKPPAGILDRGLLGAVSILYDLGITRGAGFNQDGQRLYQPGINVSGDQMAMFLVRLLAHTNVRVTDETPDLTAEELPEIQTDGSRRQRNLGGSPTGNDWDSTDEIGANIPLDSDPPTRPPREINFYGMDEPTPSNVFHGGKPEDLGPPFSLQAGDWYWEGNFAGDRFLNVVVEVRTGLSYVEGRFPFVGVLSCFIKQEDIESGNSRHGYSVWNLFKVGPGLFREIGLSDAPGTWSGLGDCVLADYNVPVPPGGYSEYTAYYPCDEPNTRRTFSAERELPACPT